jgi:hypothetical protein
VKALSGTDDQGGGLVWRYQDARNYYLTRWNPLEKNLRLYVVKDGVRSKFGDKEIDVAPGWHTIGVSMQDDAILVTFNGERGDRSGERHDPRRGARGALDEGGRDLGLRRSSRPRPSLTASTTGVAGRISRRFFRVVTQAVRAGGRIYLCGYTVGS